jgi:hypothetical protein
VAHRTKERNIERKGRGRRRRKRKKERQEGQVETTKALGWLKLDKRYTAEVPANPEPTLA